MSWWIMDKPGIPCEVYSPQRESPTPRVGDTLMLDDRTWVVTRVTRMLQAERRNNGHYLDMVVIKEEDRDE